MPRQGKQLNIWIPDDVMAALEQWILEQGTTKTDGVIQAIQVLTGTHPEAPPDLRVQVAELATEVRGLHDRVEQLESRSQVSPSETLREQAQEIPPELDEEVQGILEKMGVSLEAATGEQLHQIAKALRIRVSRSWTQEQLRQRIRDWRAHSIA